MLKKYDKNRKIPSLLSELQHQNLLKYTTLRVKRCLMYFLKTYFYGIVIYNLLVKNTIIVTP